MMIVRGFVLVQMERHIMTERPVRVFVIMEHMVRIAKILVRIIYVKMEEQHVIMLIKKYVNVLVRLVRMVKIAKINIRTIIVEQVY